MEKLQPSEASQEFLKEKENELKEKEQKKIEAIDRFKKMLSGKIEELESEKTQLKKEMDDLISGGNTQEAEKIRKVLEMMDARIERGKALLNFSPEEIQDKDFKAFPEEASDEEQKVQKLAA